jgi:outer membrane protein assembly factor BamD (BamD/ComL family)
MASAFGCPLGIKSFAHNKNECAKSLIFCIIYVKFIRPSPLILSISYKFVFEKKSSNDMTSEEWYLKGNEERRHQHFDEAIHCYMEAIALDAKSPAVEAKRMLEDIYSFYCKDYYNP